MRDGMNLSLPDVTHADVRDNIRLELEYKKFKDGSKKGGTGISIDELKSKIRADT